MTNKNERHVDAECQICGKTYQQPQVRDCMNNATGRSVGGFDGNYWYGYDANGELVTYVDAETDDRVTLRWLNAYPFGGPYDACERCVDRHHRNRESSDYYSSEVEPADFDPTFAGERWGDDY